MKTVKMKTIEVYGWGVYEVPRGWSLYEVPGGTCVRELSEQAPILVLGWRSGTFASPSEVLIAAPGIIRIGRHAWVRGVVEEEEIDEED